MATLVLAPALAHADPTLNLSVPPGRVEDSVVALAVQANVSVAVTSASCGRTRGVSGRMSVIQALGRLLEGTGCTFRQVDERTFAVVAAAPAVRPAPLPVAPPGPSVIPSAPTRVAEVVVTATLRPLIITQAPYPITTVGGDVLDRSSTRDSADLTAHVAGMEVTNLGPGRNKIFVRGLSDSPITGLAQSVVGIYLDGSRLSYDAPDPALRLSDIDRVEVLRGPQSTLYGAGSMGGIVQIVSRRPTFDRSYGSLSAGGGVTSGGSPSGSVDAVLNLALAPDRLSLRGVAYLEEIGGHIDDINLHLRDTGSARRLGGRLVAAWRIDDAWSLRASLVGQEIRYNDSQYGFDALHDERALQVREPGRNDFGGLALAAEGRIRGASVRLTSTAQVHDLAVRQDATLGTAIFGGSGGPAADDRTDHIRALEHEAVVTSPAGGRLTWLVGAFMSDSSHLRVGRIAELNAAAPLYATRRIDHIHEYALFGEATWRFTPRLSVTTGGRLFRLTADTDAVTRQGGAITDVFVGEDAGARGFAPKLVIDYRLNNRLSLYASAAEGYRAGGFNTGLRKGQTYALPGTGTAPYRHFNGDEMENFEIGGRATLFHRSLTLRAALFDLEWRDIQSDRIGADGLPFTANIGNGRNVGFEVEARFISGRWIGLATALINDPEVTRPNAGLPLPGDPRFPGVASFTANLDVRRDLTVLGRPAFVEMSLGYVGASKLDFSASVSSNMGGYATSEMSAGLEIGRWSIDARISNLGDFGGDTFNYGNPYLLGRVEVSTPQRPTTGWLELRRHF